MDSNTGDSEEDGGEEVELRQLLMELQQLTKQQTSYTTVLQSLNERQSAVNDRLLQIGAAVESRQLWKKLRNMSLLEQQNESLQKQVDELRKAEQFFDARLRDLKCKLSESTSNSKKLFQSKQQLLEDIDGLRAKFDSTKLEQEQQQVELNRLRASVEEISTEKRRLLQRVNELAVDAERVSVLQRETVQLRGKIADMERLQALRNLRELEESTVNDQNEYTNKIRLELIEETKGAEERNKCSG